MIESISYKLVIKNNKYIKNKNQFIYIQILHIYINYFNLFMQLLCE